MSDFESEEMGWRYRVDAITISPTDHREGRGERRINVQEESVSFNIPKYLVRPCDGFCEMFVSTYVALD